MQSPHHQNASNDASAEKLQDILRAETSAVETYELALESVTHVGLHRALQEILTSHIQRVEQVRFTLGRLGTEPAKGSGIWGAFAKALQAGADLLGDRVAITALEQGEDRILAIYTGDLSGIDQRTRSLIETDLLPLQRDTHDRCRTLKSYMNAPS
jgi:demethoxyubiquinone hydroxylase (CLK1/Coq7/Cat5 family)